MIKCALFCRELLENLIAPKPKRLSAASHDELTRLLLAKDAELQAALALAGEQVGNSIDFLPEN